METPKLQEEKADIQEDYKKLSYELSLLIKQRDDLEEKITFTKDLMKVYEKKFKKKETSAEDLKEISKNLR